MMSDDLHSVFQLPTMLGNLMGLLMEKPTVTVRMAQQITPKPKAAMFRLRKHLESWKIEVHSRRYVGYWIEDRDKARIRAYVTAKMENE
jgi:hypothetical protein